MSSHALGRSLGWCLAAGLLAASALGSPLVHSMDEPTGSTEGPRELLLEVRDAAGRPLAARVELEALSAPREPAAWPARRTVLRTAGDLRTPLAPGRHRLRVSHGPRHDVVVRELGARPGTSALRVVLGERVPSLGYECVDLHVHSTNSPDHHGGVSALDLDAEGLDLTVATDHNRAGALVGGRLPAVSGVELTSWAPEIGHFNAFPVTRVPGHTGHTPARLFEALHAEGEVFVQVNHPRLEDHIAFFTLGGLRGARFRTPGFTLHGADGVEVWNGYDIARPEAVLRVLDELTRFHARGQRVLPTAGSDSHGAHLPGYPRTCVRRAPGEPLAGALKRGDVYVTNGPTLALRVDGRAPGEHVDVAESGRVHVALSVDVHPDVELERVELWVDGSRLLSVPWRRPSSGPQLVHAALDVRGAASLHARVVGGRGLGPIVGRADAAPLAFTAPVYLRGHGRLASRD